MAQRKWSRDELILALSLYLQIPFGQMHHSNSRVIELANLIGRTPASIAIRLGNFASCDPFQQARGIKGMPNGRSVCQPVWEEFIDHTEDLIYYSEMIKASLQNTGPGQYVNQFMRDFSETTEDEKVASAKIRLTQGLFRKLILDDYNHSCAISGLDIDELLVASHIVPWAVDARNRLNPENGICLSPLYDKAFDQGLIGIDTNYVVLLSTQIQNNKLKQYFPFFRDVEGTKIRLPKNYPPDKEFLGYHLEMIFRH